MSDEEPENEEVDAGWLTGEGDLSRKPPRQPLDASRMTPILDLDLGSERRPGGGVDMRATVPPPVPASEYVAAMMGQAPESELRSARASVHARMPSLAERHRAILQTLHEEDPLRFDFDDFDRRRYAESAPSSQRRVAEIVTTMPGPVSEAAPAAPDAGADDGGRSPSGGLTWSVSTLPPELLESEPPSASSGTDTMPELPFDSRGESATALVARRRLAVSAAPPSIEMSEAAVDDIDPELLKDTPIPPRPPIDADFDELDDLPVDEVLASVEQARASKQAPPPRHSVGFSLERLALHTATIQDLPAEELDLGVKLPEIPQYPADLEFEDVHGRATIPGFNPDDPIDKIHDRFVVGDYSGALVLAEALLAEQPHHLEAKRYAENCREALREMYLSRIGRGDRVAKVIMGPEQLRWLTLDHRAGFLLSCIDGSSSIDEILDVSGMPGIDALRILYDLLQEGVISVEDVPSRRGP